MGSAGDYELIPDSDRFFDSSRAQTQSEAGNIPTNHGKEVFGLRKGD